MILSKLDILNSPIRPKCADCGDLWGTYWALDGGICKDPLCFACILKYIDEINAVIG